MTSALRARAAEARAVSTCRRFLASPFASVQMILFAGAGLLLFGLMMSASTTIAAGQHAGGNGASWSQLARETMYLLLGLPVFWLAVRMPPWVYRRLAYPALALALVVLGAVLVPGIGLSINHARRWIALGPLTVQPSEFAKLAVLLWGADLLARKESLRSLKRARHLLIPLVPVFGIVVALVVAESDLGTTLCFLLLLLGLLWMVGLPLRYFAALVMLCVGAVAALAHAQPWRLARITTYLHPNLDPNDTGYHTIQGLYALASGGVFGVGLGQGTSKYGWVPNANTDYVFSVIGEELGLVGCVAVLALFALFTYAAIRVARRGQDCFVRLVASGTAVWIAGQALINVGYVTALLPVTGIPLPFISSGGTSLVLTCGVLGMLVSCARHEPAAMRAAQRAASAGTQPAWICRFGLGVPTSAITAPPRRARRPAQPRRARQPAQPRRARQPAPQSGAGTRSAPPLLSAKARPQPIRTTTRAEPARTSRRAAPQRESAGRQSPAGRPLRPTGTADGRR